MYADHETDSMRKALSETNRRRQIQQAYNEAHGITPTTIVKKVRDLISISKKAEKDAKEMEKDMESMSRQELEELVKTITKQMHTAAAELNFELAARLRDKMVEIKKQLLEL
jgi:excinuclease ABC subunit B